MDIEVSGIG